MLLQLFQKIEKQETFQIAKNLKGLPQYLSW